jgi:hypothetical protein
MQESESEAIYGQYTEGWAGMSDWESELVTTMSTGAMLQERKQQGHPAATNATHERESWNIEDLIQT